MRWFRGALIAVVWAAAVPAHARGMDNFWMGLNGVLTAPADPILGIVDPPPEYDSMPLHEVTGRVFGFAKGTLVGLYRAGTGLLDIAATPFWVLPNVSPKARVSLVVGPNGVSAGGSVGNP